MQYSFYHNLLLQKSASNACIQNKAFTYQSIERKIAFDFNSTASRYPIIINVTGPCQDFPKNISLFIKNLTCINFLNLGIVLVNPQNFGVVLFYNPDAELPPQQQLIGSQTFQGPTQVLIHDQELYNPVLLQRVKSNRQVLHLQTYNQACQNGLGNWVLLHPMQQTQYQNLHLLVQPFLVRVL